jgi:hypothetical protein
MTSCRSWTVGRLLGTDDVGEIRGEDLHAEDIEPNRAAPEIIEAAGSGRGEGDVQASRSRDEVPEVGSGQGCSGAVERQALRHALRVDAGIQLTECRSEPLEILRIAGGRDVGIGGQTRKALEPRCESADQNVRNVVPAERLNESLRIERGALRHDVPPTRSGSRCLLRAAAAPA